MGNRKPVNCGCGGEAKVAPYHGDGYESFYVYCQNCNTDSDYYETEIEAIEAWNRAMGNVEKSSTVERTAKVEMLLCGNCHESNIFDVVTRQHYKYCPSCGCRLEWNE